MSHKIQMEKLASVNKWKPSYFDEYEKLGKLMSAPTVTRKIAIVVLENRDVHNYWICKKFAHQYEWIVQCV
jgi:hypothetical protein